MRDVIFISLENWDGIWRRNQFLCAEWLRRFPDMRLLFVGRSRDVSHSLRHLSVDALRETHASRERAARETPFRGLTLLNPWKWLPNSIGVCRRLNTRLLRTQIRVAARKAGLRSPLLWINDHCAEPLVGHLGERAVVYDITDDWTLMPAVGEEERSRIVASDARLCAGANLVVVCSDALERSRRHKCRRLVKVPNGVDAEHYRACRNRTASVGEAQPVFGYVGTLHGDRLDIELIKALAKAFPEGRVTLCGPDFLTDKERAELSAQPNIERTGPVDYSEVPEVIARFDVCILPHRCTPFTESLNPIKLWEYLASSKPVAATPVAGFREKAHLCHLGAGVDGFVAACTAALREDPARACARVREAESNSWSARSSQLLEVFREQGWLGRPLPKPVNPRGLVRTAERRVPQGPGWQGNFQGGLQGENEWGQQDQRIKAAV